MDEYLVSSLKRLYDDCYNAIEEDRSSKVGDAIVDRYHELLEEIHDEFPENDRIQNLEGIDKSGYGGRAIATDVQEVKFAVTSIADSLGLDSEDFKNVEGGSDMPIIQIKNEQSQTQEQTQEQYVTVEDIQEEVDRLMTSPEKRQLIEKRIEEFESEIEEENPDKERMIDAISFVRDTSTQLASKLAMRALQHGVDIIGYIE